jgi:membrane-bound serine protease (ClpP class)
MIGQQGVVHKALAPQGSVRIKGELWKAETVEAGVAIAAGQSVVVRKLRGLTLLVAPQDPED